MGMYNGRYYNEERDEQDRLRGVLARLTRRLTIEKLEAFIEAGRAIVGPKVCEELEPADADDCKSCAEAHVHECDLHMWTRYMHDDPEKAADIKARMEDSYAWRNK